MVTERPPLRHVYGASFVRFILLNDVGGLWTMTDDNTEMGPAQRLVSKCDYLVYAEVIWSGPPADGEADGNGEETEGANDE